VTGKTHLIIGLTAGLALALFTNSTVVNGLAITAAAGVGSLVPDIDTPNSTISNKARPIRLFTFWIPHRTLTHSLIVLGLVSLLSVLSVFGVAFAIGYASHIVADMSTTRGIPLFYPLWGRSLHLLPYPLRLTTGGLVESGIFLIVWIAAIGLFLKMLGVDVLTILRSI